MAVNYTDFDKIWASASPLTPYEFSENNYKAGWNFVGATPPSRQMWDAFMKNADEKLQYLYHHEDVPLGHEYFTFNPNIPQGSLPLFGGEYSRETYSDLWAWVQQQTGYLKTEAEWQTLSASNNGNVPYYSDGDGSTTFRVPSLKCWVKGANGTVTEVGSYLEAGLPDIDGGFTIGIDTNASGSLTPAVPYTNTSGAFSISDSTTTTKYFTAGGNVTDNIRHRVLFNASNSNSIYGNASTVQPESIVGMWLVKAYGVIVDTGQIDEQQYIDDRIAAEVTRADGKYESVVASGSDYIRYDSGLQICWGYAAIPPSTNVEVTFPVAFINNAPSVSLSPLYVSEFRVYAVRSTNFTTSTTSTNSNQGGYWVAIGYWK